MKYTSFTGALNDAERMIEGKHQEYLTKARLYSILYYVTRLVTGLSAALLPFVVGKSQSWASILAVIVAVLTVIDAVFSPKDRWVLFSKATDMVSLAKMKAKGEYETNKEIVDLILQTETGNLQQLVSLQELIEQTKRAAKSGRK